MNYYNEFPELSYKSDHPTTRSLTTSSLRSVFRISEVVAYRQSLDCTLLRDDKPNRQIGSLILKTVAKRLKLLKVVKVRTFRAKPSKKQSD